MLSFEFEEKAGARLVNAPMGWELIAPGAELDVLSRPQLPTSTGFNVDWNQSSTAVWLWRADHNRGSLVDGVPDAHARE